MLRKLVVLARRSRSIGFGVFWFVTIPGDGAGERARRTHAESRQRQDHVLRGRLRLLPRDAGAGRQDQARRRASD